MIGELSAAYVYPNLMGNSAAPMKVSVPVRPLLLPAMVFEHVLAVPARTTEEATPAYKVQLLEDLIARLAGAAQRTPSGSENGSSAARQIQDRIAALGSRLQTAAAAMKPFSAGLLPAAGTFVNRLA